MRNLSIIMTLTIFLISCTSVEENVRMDKAKFIEVAKASIKNYDLDSIDIVDVQASISNASKYLQYIHVESINVIYTDKIDAAINIDSVVVFGKSGYKILYDFAQTERETARLKSNVSLMNLKQVDTRLYIGKN